uniref:Histidine--tRNA ligase, chloroplastic n=1 Tax=Bulboplastis apyrenoidosa TaxID=1070855 RepID=A0A1Y9TM79_9RHOD|nr:histidine tRNA synthetase [Bulboplastis apyrenoidosa]ARO90745.1 histidine tRNA synthetase [Bulboplastis apyrenoidosa]
MKFQCLRGTKDLLYNDIFYWNLIENKAKQLFTTFNYEEIKTPIIENKALFEKGVGQFTDIVSKEMYTFQDKKSRDITLRPEGTASIVRAFIEHKVYANNKLQKWWYLGPMFRYERPQSGRQRQFHQLGLECIGSNDPLIDAEIISIAYKFLGSFLDNYYLEINSIGEYNDRINYQNSLVEYLQYYEKDLDLDSQIKLKNNPIKILDSKDLQTQKILDKAPSLSNFINSESKNHFQKVCDCLDSLKIPYRVNTKLVRGLDYYNNTAFEIKTNDLNAQDTICGGGRYNELVQQLGGPATPAIGWAIGVERLMLLLQNQVKQIENIVDFYIITTNCVADNYALSIGETLRQYGYRVEIDMTGTNLSKKLKKASQINTTASIILGESEVAEQSFTVKWMHTKTQEKSFLNDMSLLVDKLYKM